MLGLRFLNQRLSQQIRNESFTFKIGSRLFYSSENIPNESNQKVDEKIESLEGKSDSIQKNDQKPNIMKPKKPKKFLKSLPQNDTKNEDDVKKQDTERKPWNANYQKQETLKTLFMHQLDTKQNVEALSQKNQQLLEQKLQTLKKQKDSVQKQEQLMEIYQALGNYKEIEQVYQTCLQDKLTLNQNIQNIMFSALIDQFNPQTFKFFEKMDLDKQVNWIQKQNMFNFIENLIIKGQVNQLEKALIILKKNNYNLNGLDISDFNKILDIEITHQQFEKYIKLFLDYFKYLIGNQTNQNDIYFNLPDCKPIFSKLCLNYYATQNSSLVKQFLELLQQCSCLNEKSINFEHLGQYLATILKSESQLQHVISVMDNIENQQFYRQYLQRNVENNQFIDTSIINQQYQNLIKQKKINENSVELILDLSSTNKLNNIVFDIFANQKLTLKSSKDFVYHKFMQNIVKMNLQNYETPISNVLSQAQTLDLKLDDKIINFVKLQSYIMDKQYQKVNEQFYDNILKKIVQEFQRQKIKIFLLNLGYETSKPGDYDIISQNALKFSNQLSDKQLLQMFHNEQSDNYFLSMFLDTKNTDLKYGDSRHYMQFSIKAQLQKSYDKLLNDFNREDRAITQYLNDNTNSKDESIQKIIENLKDLQEFQDTENQRQLKIKKRLKTLDQMENVFQFYEENIMRLKPTKSDAEKEAREKYINIQICKILFGNKAMPDEAKQPRLTQFRNLISNFSSKKYSEEKQKFLCEQIMVLSGEDIKKSHADILIEKIQNNKNDLKPYTVKNLDSQGFKELIAIHPKMYENSKYQVKIDIDESFKNQIINNTIQWGLQTNQVLGVVLGLKFFEYSNLNIDDCLSHQIKQFLSNHQEQLVEAQQITGPIQNKELRTNSSFNNF